MKGAKEAERRGGGRSWGKEGGKKEEIRKNRRKEGMKTEKEGEGGIK